MKIRILTILSAVLCMAATSSHAATTIYTARTVFEASLPTGNFFNNFSGVPDAINGPVLSVSGSGGTPTIPEELHREKRSKDRGAAKAWVDRSCQLWVQEIFRLYEIPVAIAACPR